MKSEIFRGDPVALNWKARDGSPGTARPTDGPAPQMVRVQLSPFGEFPLRDGGSRHGEVQRCTREAFGRLVARWEAEGGPEILVDTDHASEGGGGTGAAAWARNLRVEDDGIATTFHNHPYGNRIVILGKDGDGLKILSAYEAADKAAASRRNPHFKRVLNHKEGAI